MSSEDTSSAEWSQVNLAGNAESLWMGTTPSTHYPPLEKGVEVDVAILGGGIAGMTAAYAVASIDYRWSAQDSSPVDRVPYIGKQPLAEHLYVTTGYGEWGMTTSLVSARLLTDLIQGSTNAWASLYSPSRIKPIAGAKNLFRAVVCRPWRATCTVSYQPIMQRSQLFKRVKER